MVLNEQLDKYTFSKSVLYYIIMSKLQNGISKKN